MVSFSKREVLVAPFVAALGLEAAARANTKNVPATVTFEGTKTSVLTRKSYTGKIDLPAYGAELLQ